MRRIVTVLLVGVFTVTACGARLTDEQKAALETDDGDETTETSTVGSNSASGDTSSTTGRNGSGRTTTSSAGSGGSDGSGNGSGGSGGGGDGSGGGDGGAVVAAGSSCGGGGSSDVGVTESEIKIGNVSSISGPIPGFGQTGVNAVKAYLNYANANGGVCGRQLSLVAADDRIQAGTNKAETDKLKDQVFAFAGGTTVVDDGAAQSLKGTNIAYTGLATTEAMIRSPNNFPTQPIDIDDGGNGALGIFRYLAEVEGVSRGGLVWPAQATAKARIEGYRKDMERAGIEVVLNAEVAVTETNYAGVAANVASNEVDVLVTTLEITGMSNLARAMQTEGYFPKVPFYGAQAYGRGFLERAGGAAEPTVLGLAYSILEDADSIPMAQEFLTWYENTNPGADIDFFAIEGWVAADMLVSAMRRIEGPPTRDALLAQLEGLTEYDAGGFIAPINPAEKQGSGCFMIAKVRDGQWYRDHPDSPGFDCSYA